VASVQIRDMDADVPGSVKMTKWVMACAIVCCVSQILWFGSKCIHQIDYDGMAYTGIARHLRQGEWHEAVNAFRSPLLSWLIAAATFEGKSYPETGKVINVAAFLLSGALLYLLTKKLWQSSLAASVATLLFALGRGLAAATVAMITPDFLFASLTLVCFVILLRCLRKNGLLDWFALGTVHGVAFLAKAFALPWLAVCTAVAVILSAGGWKTKIARLSAAALVPVLVPAAWMMVLHAKYGVYTTGTQFKANLFQWTLHVSDDQISKDDSEAIYRVLRDSTKEIDDYMVDDPMPPGSGLWRYPIRMKAVLPKIWIAVERNVPQVLKETELCT